MQLPLPLPEFSPETMDRLRIYEALLGRWQAKINLVAPSTLADAWQRHFEDSLQLVPYVPHTAKTLIDIGSGAGFPGLVLAIACPHIKVHLVESDQKKCSFLKTVSRETGIAIDVHCERIEKALPLLDADVVSARALASLTQLLGWTQSQWSKPKPAQLLFPKGAGWQQEIEAAAQVYDFVYDAYESRTEAASAILCIRTVTQKA